MGEGKHLRFTRRGRRRARPGGRLRPHVAARGARRRRSTPTFALELNEWQRRGRAAAGPALRHRRPSPGPIARAASPSRRAGRRSPRLDAPLGVAPAPPAVAVPRRRDRRGGGIAGMLGALVASGEPVLVVCADAALRAAAPGPALGGFALCSYDALAARPGPRGGLPHVVALDPPSCAAHADLLAADLGTAVHLAWGPAEVALRAPRRRARPRPPRPARGALPRAARTAPGDRSPTSSPSRSRARARRLLAVLAELGLVVVDPADRRGVGAAGRAHRPRALADVPRLGRPAGGGPPLPRAARAAARAGRGPDGDGAGRPAGARRRLSAGAGRTPADAARRAGYPGG